VDNDLDGLIDAQDEDCTSITELPEAQSEQAEPEQQPHPEAEDCTNWLDDDLDGMTDAQDTDCASTPVEPEAQQQQQEFGNATGTIEPQQQQQEFGNATGTIEPQQQQQEFGNATGTIEPQQQAENCANGVDDNNQDCTATTPISETEICDNDIDDDLDGLADTNDRVDCPISEEQTTAEQRQEQKELEDILVDIAPPIMNKEQVEEKFPITKGELPQGFRLVPVGGDLSTSTLPRIDYLGQWSKDDLNVYILVDKQTEEQSQKFLVNASDAITGISHALKNYSGYPEGFNANIIQEVDQNSPVADIVILLVGDSTGDKGCNDKLGFAKLHDDAATPAYAEIFTSCLNHEMSHNTVYTTVKHEFLHALGLGHAHHVNGDLMCSSEPDINGNPVSTCDFFHQGDLAEPSDNDINSMLYMYGKDGFGGNNENVDAYPHYENVTTSTFDNEKTFAELSEELGRNAGK